MEQRFELGLEGEEGGDLVGGGISDEALLDLDEALVEEEELLGHGGSEGLLFWGDVDVVDRCKVADAIEMRALLAIPIEECFEGEQGRMAECKLCR